MIHESNCNPSCVIVLSFCNHSEGQDIIFHSNRVVNKTYNLIHVLLSVWKYNVNPYVVENINMFLNMSPLLTNGKNANNFSRQIVNVKMMWNQSSHWAETSAKSFQFSWLMARRSTVKCTSFIHSWLRKHELQLEMTLSPAKVNSSHNKEKTSFPFVQI